MFWPIRQESPGDELFRILALASSDMSRFLHEGLSRLRTPYTGGFVVSRVRLGWPRMIAVLNQGQQPRDRCRLSWNRVRFPGTYSCFADGGLRGFRPASPWS